MPNPLLYANKKYVYAILTISTSLHVHNRYRRSGHCANSVVLMIRGPR